MPTYEYECENCGTRFEITRGFHEEGGDDCPHCGNKGRQIFSPAPIIYKCGGFYVTDTKDKKPSAAGGAASARTESSKTTPAPKAEAGKTPAKVEPGK
jgi:putative FmdB family regulatory protein